MAREKSESEDGGGDADRKTSAGAGTPPNLTSDPVDPQDLAPDRAEAERRALDTFAAEPTPGGLSGRAPADPEDADPYDATPGDAAPYDAATGDADTTRDAATGYPAATGDEAATGDATMGNAASDATRDAATGYTPIISDGAATGAAAADANRDAAADSAYDPYARDRAGFEPYARDPATTAPIDEPASAPAESEPAAYAPAADAAPAPPPPRRGSSFASRALTFLILLLAGAALGIWAAPKLAPMLPAGLAPVAQWLTPGRSETEARITALETGLGEVGAQVAAAPTIEAVERQVSAAQTDLGAQITAIRDTLSESDFTEATERIGRLETTITGAATELASLKDQIAAGGAQGLGDAAAASIDTYRAELDGLRAEVSGLSGSISGLGGRLDETMASAEARATKAEADAAAVEQEAVAARDLSTAQADVAAIRAALADGAPFAEPLAQLATNAGVTPPAGLTAAADTGVATPAMLRATFSDEAHEAIRASIVAGAGDGVMARSRAFLESHVASRSLTPREGASPDAVLSRMEDALRRDDVPAALTEAGQLPSEAATAMGGWIAAAKLRADAEAGLAEISTSVAAIN